MSDVAAQLTALRGHGWRQGSVLPSALMGAARDAGSHQHPTAVNVELEDWGVVVSHTCDVQNRAPKLDNEPTVEVLVVRKCDGKPDSRETHGKVSRRIHFEGQRAGETVNLTASAHDRFKIDRLLLAFHPPDTERVVEHRTLQTLVGWIAKRYQRQAFPDEFDAGIIAAKAKDKINRFLSDNAKELLGVFIAFADRKEQATRFHAEFRLVVKTQAVQTDWVAQKKILESTFNDLWSAVQNLEVEVVAIQANKLSIGEIAEGRFQKFDRDWISYESDPDSGPAPEGDIESDS